MFGQCYICREFQSEVQKVFGTLLCYECWDDVVKEPRRSGPYAVNGFLTKRGYEEVDRRVGKAPEWGCALCGSAGKTEESLHGKYGCWAQTELPF